MSFTMSKAIIIIVYNLRDRWISEWKARKLEAGP